MGLYASLYTDRHFVLAGVEMAVKKRAKESTEPPEQGAKKIRPTECRRLMRERLAAAYPEILGAFVKTAKKGSVAHMKLATELLEKKAAVARRRGGSGARLLRELEERDGGG